MHHIPIPDKIERGRDDIDIPDILAKELEPAGLFLRGGFYPGPSDAVPALPGGAPAATVLLAGNAGGAMWTAFRSDGPGPDPRNPLDSWLKPQILAAADAVGAHAVPPNEGPPYVPIQDWAMRADPVHRSPTGIMIHPEFGLWHVYRAAFLFADRIEFSARVEIQSPCDSCAAKPCLTVCPVDAFKPDRFDFKSCADHVAGPSGAPCRERGCMARRACPVGREFTYPRDAQEFHTAAFLRAARKY